MNQEVKKLWVEALRSGKYKQGRLQLRSWNDEYCCLGVLCDLYMKSHKLDWSIKGCYGYALPDGEQSYLNRQVQEWSGLDKNPKISYNGESHSPLADLNDRKKLSFSEIADLIEENL